MKKILALVYTLVLVLITLVVPASESKLAIGEFLRNIDPLNIALAAFALFFSGIWWLSREKLRRIGEMFLKAYEYTDDHVLDPQERHELKRRFMEIMGKTIPPLPPPAEKKGIIKRIFKKGEANKDQPGEG